MAAAGGSGDGDGPAMMTIATTMTTMTAHSDDDNCDDDDDDGSGDGNDGGVGDSDGGAQTTINLSYRNGGGCSWATAGRRLRNVKGKGEDGGTVTVMGEEAMPPNLGIVRLHP